MKGICLRLLAFGLLCVGNVAHSSEKVIMQLMRTKSQFEYYIEQYPSVVVFCYALPEHSQQKEQEIRRVYSILQKNMIQHSRDYGAAHVKFIAVNRSVGDLIELQKEYGLKNNNAYLIFFKHGKAVAMKVLPEAVSAQKINELIAARHLEKTELEQQEPEYFNEEYEELEPEDSLCSSCPPSSENCTQYCSNRLCKFCRYKKPLSFYDQPDFVTGYGAALGQGSSYANYWGGTMTNPIN